MKADIPRAIRNGLMLGSMVSILFGFGPMVIRVLVKVLTPVV